MCDSVFCLLPLLAHTVKNFHILCSVEFLASPLFLFFSGAIITCQDCGQPCPGAQRVTMKMERVLHVITSKYILLSLKQCKYIYKECLWNALIRDWHKIRRRIRQWLIESLQMAQHQNYIHSQIVMAWPMLQLHTLATVPLSVSYLMHFCIEKCKRVKMLGTAHLQYHDDRGDDDEDDGSDGCEGDDQNLAGTQEPDLLLLLHLLLPPGLRCVLQRKVTLAGEISGGVLSCVPVPRLGSCLHQGTIRVWRWCFINTWHRGMFLCTANGHVFIRSLAAAARTSTRFAERKMRLTNCLDQVLHNAWRDTMTRGS